MSFGRVLPALKISSDHPVGTGCRFAGRMLALYPCSDCRREKCDDTGGRETRTSVEKAGVERRKNPCTKLLHCGAAECDWALGWARMLERDVLLFLRHCVLSEKQCRDHKSVQLANIIDGDRAVKDMSMQNAVLERSFRWVTELARELSCFVRSLELAGREHGLLGANSLDKSNQSSW